MKLHTSFLLFIGVLSISQTTFAGDTNRQAKAAFDNAVKLFKNGYYEEAADEFRKANAVKPTYTLLYNIGQSEAAAKRYGLAYDAFEEYLSRGGDDIIEERRKQVVAEMERLSKMIGSLEIAAPPGCTVFIDDRDRGTTPLPGRVKLAVGVVHKIEIKKDGETIHTNNIKVSYGELIREEIKSETAQTTTSLVSDAEEAAFSEPEAKSTQSRENFSGSDFVAIDRYKPLKISGLVTLASGGAMLAAAVITGVVALNKNVTIKKNCGNSICDEGEKTDVLSRDTLAISTDVLIGVGATATVLGTVLLVLSIKNSKGNETTVLRALPTAGLRGAGIEITGAF